MVYFALATLYAQSIPLWEAVDEAAHFSHVDDLSATWWPPTTKRLRRQPSGTRSQRDILSFARHGERSQAPLFYWISAPILKGVYQIGERFEWHDFPPVIATGLFSPLCFSPKEGFNARAAGPLTLRAFSILIGALTIYFIYALALVLELNESIAMAGAALCACTPTFTRVAATINNDTLAITFCTLSLLGMAAWLQSDIRFPRMPVLLTVLATFLALLSKLTSAMMVPLVFWILARKYRMKHPVALAVFTSAALYLGLAAVLHVLLGLVELPHFLHSLHNRLVTMNHLSFSRFIDILVHFHSILWVDFGWNGRMPINRLIPAAFDLVALCGLLGFVAWYRADSRRGDNLALLPVSLFFGIVVVLRVPFTNSMGGFATPRYLYPVISSFSLMVIIGIHHLMPPRAKKLFEWAWIPFALISLIALVNYLRILGVLEGILTRANFSA